MTVLHHLALGARDPDHVSKFYRDVLGLAELSRQLDDGGNVRAIWLDLGSGVILMIERCFESLPRAESIRSGLFLLALRVTAEERAAVEEKLNAAGTPVESRTAYTSYARDPEGNRVAISHYPHDSYATTNTSSTKAGPT